jgi:hypothetical protein
MSSNLLAHISQLFLFNVWKPKPDKCQVKSKHTYPVSVQRHEKTENEINLISQIVGPPSTQGIKEDMKNKLLGDLHLYKPCNQAKL